MQILSNRWTAVRYSYLFPRWKSWSSDSDEQSLVTGMPGTVLIRILVVLLTSLPRNISIRAVPLVKRLDISHYWPGLVSRVTT